MIELIQASSSDQIEHIRRLFVEYAQTVNAEPCFEDFDSEVQKLPGLYAPPEGCLILAKRDARPIGCVGLIGISDDVCEMKRLYVRPQGRGSQIGRGLAERILVEARRLGYWRMRLDTLATMSEAIALYKSLGFLDIEPAPNNPHSHLEGAHFMELIL